MYDGILFLIITCMGAPWASSQGLFAARRVFVQRKPWFSAKAVGENNPEELILSVRPAIREDMLISC
jgi:hypothetical protein